MKITTQGKPTQAWRKNKLLFHCFQLERSPLSETVLSFLARALFFPLSWGIKGVTVTDGVLRCKSLLGGAEAGISRGRDPAISSQLEIYNGCVSSYQINGWKWGLIPNPRSTLALSYNIMFSECSPSPQNQCMGYRLLITKDPDHSLLFNVRMRAIVLLPRLLTMSHRTFSDTQQLFIVKLSYPSLSGI